MSDSKTKIQVLWVEDDLGAPPCPEVETLEQGGDISVRIARDASEALDVLRSDVPDVVVLDIMMAPGTELPAGEVKNGYESGFALLRKIRREMKLDTPVIILTAYSKMMPEEEQRELKVAEYLSKPVKKVKLAELIRLHAKGGSHDATR